MSPAAEITGHQLTNALSALDVNFIIGGQSTNETLHKQLARLIAALAKSGESRLRLSLIPPFLNILNSRCTSGWRQKSSAWPLA